VRWHGTCIYPGMFGTASFEEKAVARQEGAKMKNLTTKLMIAAAAVAALAGTATAQTMEAKIPFAFRASGKVLPAGTYRVDLRTAPSGTHQLIMSTAKGKYQVLSFASPDGQATASWQSAGNPVLLFQCGVSRCALKDAWIGGDNLVYSIPVPKLGKDEPVHTAEIVMKAVKGD
jgi:hypothetical protein